METIDIKIPLRVLGEIQTYTFICPGCFYKRTGRYKFIECLEDSSKLVAKNITKPCHCGHGK